MPIHNKQDVLPYQSLIDFVNEEITRDNWREVLKRLESLSLPSRETMDLGQAAGALVDTYRPLGFMGPQLFKGARIVKPESLQIVQRELREDLIQLTTDPNQDLSWLVDRINHFTQKSEQYPGVGSPHVFRIDRGGMEIPMSLSVHRTRAGDPRVLLTDRVYFVHAIKDLRLWMYFRLAKLWEAGLLPRLGRCENCQQFFLAKTARKKRKYCSQRCAQGATAAKRAKESRVRRAAWGSIKKDLERALEGRNSEIVERTLTKAKQAFTAAYPRLQGPGYEEGKKLLARASRWLPKRG